MLFDNEGGLGGALGTSEGAPTFVFGRTLGGGGVEEGYGCREGVGWKGEKGWKEHF
jgi:hypothetical protein